MESKSTRSASEPVYEVVWPLGKSAAAASVNLSSPVSDLRGKTIAELWDWLFKGDEMFAIVREKLRERFPDVKFVDYRTFGNIHGPTERSIIAALPETLRQHGCDAVISAVGA